MAIQNQHPKPLKHKFTGIGEVKGYSFAMIGMTEKAFIYLVSGNGNNHYEVFKKTVNRRFACISYPTAKAFGIWAWTYTKLELAIKKYNELNKDLLPVHH